MHENKIENVFIMDNSCYAIMALLSQVSVNRDFMGIPVTDKYFDWNSNIWSKDETYRERYIKDFYIKSANYILYNKHNYLIIEKNLPKDMLKNYSVKYSTNHYVLLQKLNN
jgi:hypothetical protein